jgi:hypothetical protein
MTAMLGASGPGVNGAASTHEYAGTIGVPGVSARGASSGRLNTKPSSCPRYE